MTIADVIAARAGHDGAMATPDGAGDWASTDEDLEENEVPDAVVDR